MAMVSDLPRSGPSPGRTPQEVNVLKNNSTRVPNTRRDVPRTGTAKSGYLSLLEIAERLAIHRAQAWSIVVAKGEIPHHRIGVRTIRVAEADLERYLERTRHF